MAESSLSTSSQQPFIVLAFDEAHILTRSEAGSDDTISASSPFAHLRRALKDGSTGVFAVFLSTTGRISQFTPPRKSDPSNRVVSGVHKLVPPFTTLGWDQLAQPVRRGKLGEIYFNDIGFEYQVCLGRPM